MRRYFKFLMKPASITKGFIPDIIHILCKYNLSDILNMYVSSNTIPSKYSWKVRIKSTISANEHTLWRSRIDSDLDFGRFKHIHLNIEPAIIWTFPRNRHELYLSHQVAQLWICRSNNDVTVCGHCEQIVTDKMRHIISDCLLVEYGTCALD